MSRIRIVCKTEPPRQDSRFPRIFMVAGWKDVDVRLVDDDGSEHPITNVTSIVFRCAQGLEPASATLEFENVELDAELDEDTVVSALSEVTP